MGGASLDVTAGGAAGTLSTTAGNLGNTSASSTGLSSPRAHEISMAEIRDALEAAEAEQQQAPQAASTATTGATTKGPGRDSLARSSSTGSDSGRSYMGAGLGLAGPLSGLYSPTKLNRATRPISAVPSASPARELRPLFPPAAGGPAASTDVMQDAGALVRPQSAAGDAAASAHWASGGVAASGDRSSTIAALKGGVGATPAPISSPAAVDDSTASAAPSAAAAPAAASASTAGSWGLTDAEVSLHKRRLLAFYTVHAPAKAHNETIETAWNLFGPRVWTELERKYKGKTAGFKPSVAAA